MKRFAVTLISLYQSILSPDTGMFSRGGKYCYFIPSCSEYTKEAIMHGGVWYGVRKGIVRITKCNPWQKHFADPFHP